MLRRLGIRGKILAALSVPVLVLFVLAGTVSWQSLEDVREARAVTQLLGALDRSRELATALQDERAATLLLLAAPAEGQADARTALDAARVKVNGALGMAARAAAATDLDQFDPVVERALTGLNDQAAQLQELRDGIDAGVVDVRTAFGLYTIVAERVVNFPAIVANALDDRTIAATVVAQTEYMGLIESYKQEQALGAAVLAGARDSASLRGLTDLFTESERRHEAATLAVAQLGQGERVQVAELDKGEGTFDSYRSLMRTGQENDVEFISPQGWTQASQDQLAKMQPLLGQLRTIAITQSNDAANTALRTAAITITLTLLAVIASIAVSLTIARRIVEPLRRLTQVAGKVREDLPKLVNQNAVPGQEAVVLPTVPVTTRDEIGELATAFNEVNTTTMQVAREQAALRASIAEMFVNVARRDQVLLNRQLSFIDALERSEEDPKTLADLFRLDHLATRMRRNAESLLVLAGIDTGRRLRDAITLSDVVRTASSEIEHYERVQLDLPVDPLMLGHTGLPAAHLLAELLENATVFSEPGTPVHVSTGIDRDTVYVTVHDQGLGMTTSELAEANERMRTTSAGDVLGAQRLGLYVVGRIATRLGAQVELSTGPGGLGTLATVKLPRVLFIQTEDIPDTQPTLSGTKGETFVLPEEAAATVRETVVAPAPEGVQDVAPGSLGSVENPVEEVDLTKLTDGQTGLGLPRRRASAADTQRPAPSWSRDEDDAAAAPSIPLAPQADALAGAASVEDEAWTPPVIQPSAPLAARRAEEPSAPAAGGLPQRGAGLPTREPSTQTGNVGLPTREPAAQTGNVGLPTREPATQTGNVGLPTRAPAAPVTPAPAASTSSSAPTGDRTGMFTGFRSRRAELAAAAVQSSDAGPVDPAPSADGAERLAAAAAAGAAAFFGRPKHADEPEQPQAEEPQPPAPMVIPTLVDDDDAPEVDEPWVPTVEAPAEAVAADTEAPAAEAQAAPEWAPTFAYEPAEPVQEPVQEQAPEWAPTFGFEPAAQDMSPQDELAQTEPAAEQAPVWTPSFADDPVQEQAPVWTPSFADEPVASVEPVQEQTQVWAPSFAEEPVASVEPVQEQTQVWAPSFADEPAAPAAQAEPEWAPTPWNAEETPAWSAVEQPQQAAWPPATEQVDEVLAPEAQMPAADVPTFEEPTPVVPPAVAEAPARREFPADPSVDALAAAVQSGTGSPTGTGEHRRDRRDRSDRTAPKKRRFWPFGRGEHRATGSTPTFTPQSQEPQVPAPVAQAAPVVPPAPPVAVPLPPAAPTRASAWGAPEHGAHAAQSEVPAVPAAPQAGPVAPQLPPYQPTAPAPAPVAFEPPAPVEPAFEPLPAVPAAPAEPAAPAATVHPWEQPVDEQQGVRAPVLPLPALQSWAPPVEAEEEGGWSPTVAWSQEAPAPSLAAREVPSPHMPPPQPAAPAPAAGQTFAPQTFTPQTTFTPEPAGSGGAFDDQVTNMLAQRADLAQQALAELSQLSSYRPKVAGAGGGASTLARRTPGNIPAAPAIVTRPAGEQTKRDASEVRSLLSSFQSGTQRGRQATPAADGENTQTSDGAAGPAGQDGQESGLEPVTTPATDTQRSTSW